MSKSVLIPANMKPNFICEINGKVYSYKAGTTQTVPDDVAELIDNYNAMQPKAAPERGTPGQVWTRLSIGADWQDIPDKPIDPATQTKAGVVKQGAAVSDEGDPDQRITELLTSLRNAGIIATEQEPEE